MREDLQYASRQFGKSPGFAAAAVGTLGVGIAAAAAMFGLVQGVLLSPPPFRDPDRVVLLTQSRLDGQPYTGGASIAQWLDWRTSARTIEPPALYRWTFNFLVLPEGSTSLSGMVVTDEFFRVLGVQPVLGRVFEASEASRPKVPPTAIVLGHELWVRQFNSDPGILGRTVQLSRMPAPLPVVGVMPPGLRFLPDPAAAAEPNYDVNAFVDFWLAVAPDETQIRNRGWNAVSRVREGASLADAQRELAALAVTQVQADARLAGLTIQVRPVQEDANRDARSLLLPLFGFVALLFFVACVNVAGLFVARGLQRDREYAMRAAMGASRVRLFRQVITESALVALLGAVVAAVLATGMVSLFKAIGGQAVPRADMVGVGWPVFAFGFAAALVAAIVSGVLPAARASSPAHAQSLKGGRTTAGRAERRLLGSIATVQIVLTVALLSGAALLVRTTSNLARVRPGYDVENILAATVTAVSAANPAASRAFHTQVLERVSALPGVSRVAFAWGVPLTGNKWPSTMEIVGQPDRGQLGFPLRAITEDYFAVMGMALVDGRGFGAADTAEAPRVAIVNQTLARRYFGGQAVGRHLQFAGDAKRPLEIVGVVADTRTEALSRTADPEVYLPFWQNGAFSKHLVIRAGADPASLAALVRREVRAVEPTAAIEHMTTMEEIRRGSLAPRTFAMRLLFAASVAATLLALVGIYGVLSLSVGSRVKEIAVRKAVGAQQSEILQSVLGEGSRLILTGVVFGALVAVLVARGLQSQLYEVGTADPISLAAAAALFGAVALAACLLPALRAARADLASALRQD
jgi:putative ABC transport system permease protein